LEVAHILKEYYQSLPTWKPANFFRIAPINTS
jgi:hypothetical protein